MDHDIDDGVRAALARSGIIDITTTGRRSGVPRRLEIVVHAIDGRTYLSGMPSHRTRAWLLNLRADPRLTVHVKLGVHADIPAVAREVTDEAERRSIIGWIVRHAWPRQDPEAMLLHSPLVEVTFPALAA